MKKLVSSNEAASILGLSLQGVHYRIKKGQLESVKKDGKTYVYVDNKTQPNQHHIEVPSSKPEEKPVVNELVQVKDEQIAILKKMIKFLKKQHSSEIQRLEKNQDKILNVFQSEVDLLKSAFNEMKNIYKIEHQEKQELQKKETEVVFEHEPEFESESEPTGVEFMDIKDFFIFMRRYNYNDKQIKSLIMRRVQLCDSRFIYDKNTKELLIIKSDFKDLI